MSNLQSAIVTVAIPCYNQAHFLPEAVASVVAQHETRWELIIVDDGSPDDTAQVAQALIAANPTRAIRLLRQPNSGLGSARNAGLRGSSAPYLLPLDADDRLHPAMLAHTLRALDAHPEAAFAYSDAHWFGVEEQYYRAGPFDARRLAANNFLMPHALIRRTAFEAVRGYCGRNVVPGFEDWDVWLSLVEAGWSAIYLAEPLVGYRRSDGSMLAAARRNDLLLRARLIVRHQRLYPRSLVAWAARYASAPQPNAYHRWLPAYLAYARHSARFYPRELPKVLGRPLFVQLSARRQARLRKALRMARLASMRLF
jgi:glycosyltransferase involved in cell wall biosynthesis